MTPLPAPTTPGYSQLSQGAALNMLGERLGDPSNIYWSQAELRLYLAEALSTWQSYTAWYRQRVALNAKPGTTWYDLSSTLTPAALSYNATDQSVASAALYHLLERQIANGTWAGTGQFDLAQLQATLQNRLNRFLGDSGMVVSYTLQQSGAAPPITTVILPSTTIDIRRISWISASGVSSLLWRESDWSVHSFLTAPSDPTDPPQVYSTSVASPTFVRLAPPPAMPGLIELLSVQSGPTLGLIAPVGTPVPLGIPDDFAWGVKFGAMADLLSSDGQAKDAARAQYCESRYQECVQIAKTYPSVLGIQIAGAAVWPSSIFDLDSFKTGWQNASPGQPMDVGLAGRNLLALSPTPTAALNLTLDVVRNMVLPVADTDIIQVPTDVIPALIDYVQHLASFKMGGQEFANTMIQRASFLMAAAQYNSRLRQMDFFNDATRSPSQIAQAERPRLETPALVSYQVPALAAPTS